MFKKLLLVLLALALALSMAACGNEDKEEPNNKDNETIEVEKEIFDVIITIPANLAGEVNQQDLDEMAQEGIAKSVTLNEDGSVTYEMSKRQHKQLLEELATQLKTDLDEMIESEDFPNVTKIETNKDFTSFKVTTKNEEVDMSEGFMCFGFMIYSAMYNAFAGNADNDFEVKVKYYNADSGKIIDEWSSKDMQEN